MIFNILISLFVSQLVSIPILLGIDTITYQNETTNFKLSTIIYSILTIVVSLYAFYCLGGFK